MKTSAAFVAAIYLALGAATLSPRLWVSVPPIDVRDLAAGDGLSE